MLPRNTELNYKIKFTDDGWRRFEKLDKRIKEKVLSKLGMLSNYSQLNNVKKMVGKDDNYYRLRVGDIRVLFWVEEDLKVIWITDVGFRGAIYK